MEDKCVNYENAEKAFVLMNKIFQNEKIGIVCLECESVYKIGRF